MFSLFFQIAGQCCAWLGGRLGAELGIACEETSRSTFARSRGPNLMVPPWVLRLTVPQLRSRLALALTYRAVCPDALFATILVVRSIAGTSPGNRE